MKKILFLLMLTISLFCMSDEVIVLTEKPIVEFTLPDGSVLKNAFVWRRSSEGLMIIHDDGQFFLNFKLLTGNWKTAYLGESEAEGSVISVADPIVLKDRYKLASQLNMVPGLRDEGVQWLLRKDADDESITEIMVNGPSQVYVERAGKLELTDCNFINDASVNSIIERIVSPIGRRIDESQPYVDARLADGSRVNAIIHPLSLIGPCITIRKFSKDPFSIQDLISFGTLTAEVAEFMEACVLLRKNVIVSGGTGSGKTTLLNVLSSYLPSNERILTIEDAAELRLTQEHIVRLEARPANIEGRGAVSIRDLVRNALRMRPDRIVVGECRGAEALDMLQAMNTGHEGSMTTIHANTPRDALARLETMVLMAGLDLPIRAIREQVGSAVHLIFQISRFSDGTRKVSRVTEIAGMEQDRITLQDLFEFKQTGIDPNGKVQGRLLSTGAVPTFIEEIALRGMKFDRTMLIIRRVASVCSGWFQPSSLFAPVCWSTPC